MKKYVLIALLIVVPLVAVIANLVHPNIAMAPQYTYKGPKVLSVHTELPATASRSDVSTQSIPSSSQKRVVTHYSLESAASNQQSAAPVPAPESGASTRSSQSLTPLPSNGDGNCTNSYPDNSCTAPPTLTPESRVPIACTANWPEPNCTYADEQ